MVESPQAPPVVALRIGARLFELIVMCPLGSPGAAVPIAGSRAGELGVLNLAFAREPQAALRELRRLCELGRGDCGVLVEEDQLLEAVLASEGGRLQAVLLAGAAAQDDGAGGLSGRVARVGEAGARAIVVAASLREALAAQEAGADAVIAKGQEAGGWIGDERRVRALPAARRRAPDPGLRARRDRPAHDRRGLCVRGRGSGARLPAAAQPRVPGAAGAARGARRRRRERDGDRGRRAPSAASRRTGARAWTHWSSCVRPSGNWPRKLMGASAGAPR